MAGERPIESQSREEYVVDGAPTDPAYCLMDVVGVNMPILGDEGGRRAFLRLKEEMVKTSDNQSLFARVNRDADSEAPQGLLVPSPAALAHYNRILPFHDGGDPREPYTMANRDLCIQLHLSAGEDGIFVATIDCPVPPNYLIDIGVKDAGRSLPEMLAQATFGAYSCAAGTGNNPFKPGLAPLQILCRSREIWKTLAMRMSLPV